MRGGTGRIEHDTGLYERALLDALLKHEIAQCVRYGNPLTLLMLSSCGTQPADEVMWDKVVSIVAHSINTNLRSSDMPGHYDDDFLIIMPYTNADGARIVAERLVGQINDLLMQPAMKGAAICAGLAVHAEPKIAEPAVLVARARRAAAQARDQGPGKIVEV